MSFPSIHCSIHWDQASVTTIFFQLFFVKSTVTSLIYLVSNELFQSLYQFLCGTLDLEILFLQLWWFLPCELAFPPISLATPLWSHLLFFSLSLSCTYIHPSEQLWHPLTLHCFPQKRCCKVVNSPDLLFKLQIYLSFRPIFLSSSVVIAKSKSMCLILSLFTVPLNHVPSLNRLQWI